MLNHLFKSCTAILGIAISTLSSTGYAGVFGTTGQSVQPSPDMLEMARTQSALSANSFASSSSSPFISPKGFAANPKVYGKTYGEWGAEWWKWALSFPDGMNPVQDETGEFCALGQSGHVWFLAGSFGLTGVERHCTIPAGKAIFYPLINTTWVEEPGDEIFTDEEVRWIVASLTSPGDNACKMTSTLDTFNMPNLGELPAPITARLRPIVRAQSQKYTTELPENNILGFPPGEVERLIAEGYWVMLPPLTPGEHVLNLYGAGCEEVEDGILQKVFETEVTYHLTVTPGEKP